MAESDGEAPAAETDDPPHTGAIPGGKDNLRIQLHVPEGSDHTTVAHELIGKVNWKVKWLIGSPDANGNFEVTARGWGIRSLVEDALGEMGGGAILEREPPAQSAPGPGFGHNSGPRADSRVRVGDNSWAS